MTLDVESKETDDVTYKTRFDSDGTLYLHFASANTLNAGTPYIIKWDEGTNITEPVFTGVKLSKVFNDFESNDGKVQFLGRYAAKTYTAEDTNTLLLGDDNTLYYPQPDTSDPDDPKYPSIGACRAYFELIDASAVRAFVLNFGDVEDTGITTTDYTDSSAAWYTLGGMKLNGQPTVKGVYIHKGKKVVKK